MKPCWKDRGLTKEGAAFADIALAAFTEGTYVCDDPAILRAAFDEAMFRRFALSQRTFSFRRKYLEENE